LNWTRGRFRLTRISCGLRTGADVLHGGPNRIASADWRHAAASRPHTSAALPASSLAADRRPLWCCDCRVASARRGDAHPSRRNSPGSAPRQSAPPSQHRSGAPQGEPAFAL